MATKYFSDWAHHPLFSKDDLKVRQPESRFSSKIVTSSDWKKFFAHFFHETIFLLAAAMQKQKNV